MESKICLIRHGITEGNKKKLFYGHTDIPLAEEGIEELKKLAQSGIYPDGENADFYTTGLIRTEQTMELIYGKREHKLLEQLKEMDFGDFEMKGYRELRDLDEYKKWMGAEKGNVPPPNGESIMMFYKRIVRGFEDLKSRHALKVLSLRHKEQEAVSIVVCHGGTICAVLESLYPGEKESFYRWIPDPGHGYILRMKGAEVTGTETF